MTYYCVDCRRLLDGNTIIKDLIKTTDSDEAYCVMEYLNSFVEGHGRYFVPADHIGENGIAYDVYQVEE